MAKYLVRTTMTQDGLDIRYAANPDRITRLIPTIGAARIWNTQRAAKLFARKFSRETGIAVVHDIAPV